MKRLTEKAEDEEIKASLDWDITRLSARTDPVELDPERAAGYAGAYKPRRLTYEDGRLYYQRGDNPRIEAIPVDQDTFVFEEYDFFMLDVETDGEGNPTALVGHYRDGRSDRTPRTE